MAKDKRPEGKFTILNDEGKEIECDVLFTFDSEETGKSYVVYTDNTLDDEGNTEVYASVFDPTGTNSGLQPVESEKEWKVIETILAEILHSVADGESFINNNNFDEAFQECGWYEKMEENIKTASQKGNIEKLNELAEAVKSKLIFESDEASIKKLFRFVEIFNDYASWLISYSSLGMEAYESHNFVLAEMAFRAANNPPNVSASNNLAYIIRRGEVGNKSKYSSKDVADLLKAGVQAKDTFSLINMALLWALKVGDPDSWELADKIIQLISTDEIAPALDWWLGVARKGDVEGYLVHLWILKNNKIKVTPLGTKDELLRVVKKEINLPSFFE